MRNYFITVPLSLVLLVAAPQTRSQAETTDREVGVDFLYGNIKINNPLLAFLAGDDDATLLGLDVHAKFRVANDLWIGGRLPIAHMRWNEDSTTTLGNITALMSYRLTGGHNGSSWIDTSLSFPSADDDGDGAFVGTASALFWIPDPALYLPATTGISAIYRHSLERDRQGVEFSGGLQVLAVDNADDRMRVPLRIAGHLGLSPSAQAIARFSTIWLTDAKENEDNFLHLLEAGIRLDQVGQGQLEMLFYYPLDTLYRDTLEVYGITVGLTSAF